MKNLQRTIAMAAASTILLAGAAAFGQTANRAAPVDMEKARAAQKEASDAIGALRALVADAHVYSVESKREAALAAAKPLFEKIDHASAEFATMGAQGKATVRQIEGMTNPIRAALGEPTYVAKLEALAKGDDAKEAAGAQAMLGYAKFMAAGNDEAAQKKSVESIIDALKADPASDAVAARLFACHSSANAIKDVRARIEDVMKNTAKSPTSQAVVRQWDAAAKLAAFEGKPLTVHNFTLDGKPFSSDALKGKVVVVDFWATWCGPCIAELPRMVKLYKEYHPKGLEIISISFDKDTDDIKTFLGENKDVTWIQLFNPETPGWKAGEEWGINSIPRMFLIDKKGVVRTINGRAQMEKMIPELLGE